MYNQKKLIFGFVALLTVTGMNMPGQAAEKKDTVPVNPNAPIVFEGDELSFSDSTGEIFAKGNIKVTQNDVTILTDAMRGNTQQGDVWADGPSRFIETETSTNITGLSTHYNYKEHTGTTLDISGMVGKERVTGDSMEVLPEKYVIADGTMTRCPAKVPDYHVSASKVEIWPNDKLIAYNAKFWIKNQVIFTLPKYQKDLQENTGSAFPRIGYNNNDGAYIKQRLEMPATNNISLFGDLAYYSKSGFKPQYGAVDREKNYKFTIEQGYFQDDNDDWIKKEPEFRFEYKPKRLGNTPFTYSFKGIYGKWTDDYKTSWHQDYLLYFSRDPIKLNDTMYLSLGTGYEVVKESYNSSTTDTMRFDSTVTKVFSPKLNTWVGYHYVDTQNNLFDYGTPDLSRELDVGFNYRIDNMNAITFSQSYDLAKERVYDQDYTWHRNLHCWQLDLTYRAKRGEIKWNISNTRW